jgi:hypothetical protein
MFGKKKDSGISSLVIVALLAVGVILGFINLTARGKSTSTITLQMDIDEGVVLDVGDSLNSEDREEIMVVAIEKVVQDDDILGLLDGKDYTVEATIHGKRSIQDIMQNSSLARSNTRIFLEVEPVVTVTLTFHDGSGYNVIVDISDWSLGDPVFSEEVAPPSTLREVIGPTMNRTRNPP